MRPYSYGFVVFDAVENQDAEQTYQSREKQENRPLLILDFEAS